MMNSTKSNNFNDEGADVEGSRKSRRTSRALSRAPLEPVREIINNINIPNVMRNDRIKDAKDQIKKEMNFSKGETPFKKLFETARTKRDHTKRIHELLVQAQTEEHERPDTLFNLVIQGDFAGIKERLENERKRSEGKNQEDAMLVRKTDAAGGNVIHAAYLYQKYYIGRWLVENYPLIALEPYSDECSDLQNSYNIIIEKEDMPYTGENILHMTIVRKNLAETRWILDFYKDHKDSVPNGLQRLLLGNAVGKFFSRGNDFYCGSYPLHFAACSNDIQMFDMILAYASALGSSVDMENFNNKLLGDKDKGSYIGTFTKAENRFGSNVIFMRDQHGNNCLHLVVIHHLQSMYTHIKATAINLVMKEIRLAYADKLLSDGDDDDPYIYLTSLPDHEGFKYGFCPVETDIIAPQDRMSTEAHNSWLNEITDKKIEERMELVLNEDYHSPLTLCAAGRKGNEIQEQKKREMISFLLSQLKKDRWSYGPVKCALLPLEGIEYPYYEEHYRNDKRPLPYDIARNKMHGLIEWICITESNLSAKIPEIQKIITAKWQRFGYAIFIKQFAFRIFLTLLFTVLICFSNATPSVKNTNGTSDELVSVVSVLYPLALFCVVCISMYELPGLMKHGLDYYGFYSRRIRGAAKFEKLANTIVISSFVCVYATEYYRQVKVKLGMDIDPVNDFGTKISFSVTIIVSFLYLFYFFMGFDSTGAFVLTIYRIVSRDIPFFVTFYVIVVIAFGCALSLLTRSDDVSTAYGFRHLFLTVFSLIQITVQMQQIGAYQPEVDAQTVPENLVWVFNAFFTAFYIVVILMFLNLLIAMINNTYGKLIQYDDALLLLEKYNIMCAMESSLWFVNRKTLPQCYSVVVHGKMGNYIPLENGNNNNYNNNNNFNDEMGGDEEKEDSETRDSLLPFQKRSSNYFFEEVSRRIQTTESNNNINNNNNNNYYMNNEDYDNFGIQRQYAFEMLDEDKSWWGSKNKDISALSTGKIKKKVTLLLIMPQNDFHEEFGKPGEPGYRPRGSLAVPGSNKDSVRVREVILKNLDKIDDIIVVMDSHYPTHIAHAIFWRRGWKNPDPYNVNAHPDPFTVITYKDIIDEIWMPVQSDEFLLDWVKYYTRELEKKGRLQLTIWPEHCIIGSSGHSIVHPINESLQIWAQRKCKSVKYVMKGENLYTEMYSALVAEVEDPSDPKTGMDWDLLAELKIADKILVCGQALSHCVHFTFLDILKHWHSDVAKLHLLRNGCSSVAGFESVGLKFLEDIEKQGVTVLDCEDLKL